MKPSATLATIGLCGVFAVSAFGNSSDAKPASAKEKPARPSEASPHVTSEKATAGKPATAARDVSKTLIAGSDAEAKATEEAKSAHIRPGAELHPMETPPPPPRQEEKPASPAGGLIWVPGHWRPVKGEWTWVKGEWGFPPTPVSVWIEPRYDPVTKQWSAGYWQPDREEPYAEETPEETPLPVVKF